MKHAFLILAHNNFAALERLVGQLDCPDNDIFIHIDSKCSRLPSLSVHSAGLEFTGNRIDVRWGDLSVVMAEYELFRTAYAKGPYARYHLLSGVDVTLKPNTLIHRFFDSCPDSEFIGYTLLGPTTELIRKTGRWHLFPKSFRSAGLMKRALRHAFIRLQELCGIQRNRNIEFRKGSQWVSVTGAMASLFLENEQWVKRALSHTFCPDEIVFQTLCWNSPLREHIYSLESDGQGCMRAISWTGGQMLSFLPDRIAKLKDSPYMFARKHCFAAQVSILVPAYNAQDTLPRTLDSILAQDYPKVQICIVNDCSTDQTAAVIERYIPLFQTRGYMTDVCHHETNLGAAAARNSLLDMARGTYCIFVDADDLLAPTALTQAVDMAEGLDCDIAGWDWTLSQPLGARYMRQPAAGSPRTAMLSMLAGSMRWNLWLFMLRRSLLEGFRFTPGMNMGEDMLCMLTLMNRATGFCQIRSSLYTYRQTGSSISRSMNVENMRQVTANINAVESMLKENNPYRIPARYFDYLRLNIKLPLLVSTDKHDYLCWSEWFRASNRFIPFNRRLPVRTRLLETLAWLRLWPMVKLYNRLVYGHAYRLILNKR